MMRSIAAFFLFLTAILTASAEDIVYSRGCRRGHVPVADVNRISSFSRADKTDNSGSKPYQGQRHQLTVLVSFSDLQFKGDEDATLEQWDKMLNAVNFSEEPFVGSVHDYFYAQSYGQFDLSFDLLYVPLAESRVKYRSTDYDDENSQFLVYDIMDVLKNRSIDWSRYDWDGDGFVDQLLIIYAGKGMQDGGDSNSIWAHQWWLSFHTNPETGESIQPIVVTGDDDRLYTIDEYCAVQELSRKNDYGSFGTVCHEYSHCLGLPDFYFSGTSYVGSWDLMDYGNNNGSGFVPCNYSAHERMLMGWLTPTELTSPASIADMAALSDAPQAYIIRNDAVDNEYYIVENRQQTGWDACTAGSGLLVFHINYLEDEWTNPYKSPNHPAYHDEFGQDYSSQKHYYIIPSNNRTSTSSVAGWPYPYNGNDYLTDTSTPKAVLQNANADGFKLMSKPLTNMSVSGGLASFDFMGGTTGIQTAPLEQMSDVEVLYDIGPVRIVRLTDGTIKKVVKH